MSAAAPSLLRQIFPSFTFHPLAVRGVLHPHFCLGVTGPTPSPPGVSSPRDTTPVGFTAHPTLCDLIFTSYPATSLFPNMPAF